MNTEQFRSLIREILPAMGYRWRRFDRRNVRRRVRRRMESLGIHEATRYTLLLKEDPQERLVFENLLRVTITRFFRNAGVWSSIGDLLADMDGRPGAPDVFRAWSAGCAGGEEPFSLAMLLEDLSKRGRIRGSWEILGTDTDPASLERSRGAAYSMGSIREVPDGIRRRWFTAGEEGGVWTLDARVRNMVAFLQHDLLREDPPGRFHMVFLRNSVLTYNREEVQRRVLDGIRRCLIEPGYLVIGRTETLPEGTVFEEVSRCIYRRMGDRELRVGNGE